MIVEDEPMHLQALQNLLERHCKDVDVLETTDSVAAAKELIRKFTPDLVFLDIELIDGTGFDLLLQLDRLNFHIIFVTGHEEKAVTAFRFSATDFLAKPVNVDELKAAVEKVRESIRQKTEASSARALLEIISSGNHQAMQKVNIPGIDGFKLLDLDDIITCEADGFCTIFHLKDNRRVVSSKNLKYYEEMLVPHNFMRVHHSFMVNLKHVKEYSREGIIELTQNYSVPLGNSFKKNFLDKFNKFK
jgi:two-component system LytT family response regulator